jgi:hypothetical protein
MSCFPDGLIVTDEFRWRRPAYRDDATADLIAQRTKPIPLPSDTRVLAFPLGERRGACVRSLRRSARTFSPERRG